MATWGQSNSGVVTTEAQIGAWTRAMGGTFAGTDGVLSSVSVYLRASASNQFVRVAVYQGGALDNPNGATLVEDLGKVAIANAGSPSWATINSTTNPTLDASQPTWIVVRGPTTANQVWAQYTTVSGDSGDFQSARGRNEQSSTSNPDTAFGGTLVSGSFASFWYPWYLTYTVGPAIDTQPTAQTARINGDTTNTATFSVSATASAGGLTYDWELETSVGSGTYANLADGNGATWTGQTASSCTGTFTAKTLSGRRVRCNVTDSNGTTTTNAVTLTVLDGPVLSASTATTNGSGVASVTMTSDDALTANGEILLVTATVRGQVVARTTVRPA